MIRRVAAHLASAYNCRMRRERLIRPTGEHGFVGMIRRVAAHLAPVHNRRMRRERLIRPTDDKTRSGASGTGAQLPDAA
ncbi:hypothetical protein [Escherichia coli]|uniref:hypothetical protein n=1 Tax=Escherichia coli TaxID=562 RepID=UPI000406F17F|nr:hypothetical protein [Escherichia coli]